MLNDTQTRFLTRYLNFKGDAYKALDSLGLEMNHLFNWKMDQSFDIEYRKASQQVIQYLNQENYITGLRELNKVLKHGVTQETTTYKKEVLPDGEEKYTSSKVEKKLGVPIEALRLALNNSSVIQAITTLQNQGIIPSDIANKIMIKAEEITGQMQKAFEVNIDDEDRLDESKVINMVKTAVLGAIDG